MAGPAGLGTDGRGGHPCSVGKLVVAKIGTSSVTDDVGEVDREAISSFCGEIAAARSAGHRVIVVTSGAIAAGLPAIGLGGDRRPSDSVTLQAASAIGQARLMRVYEDAFAPHGLVSGQLLLAPLDFGSRQQYLHARSTIERLLSLGVVPIINENDAIADDEIRFGDNDRLSALVAHLVGADVLVMLTDAAGLLTADPRVDTTASLIEEIVEVDAEIEALAGGSGTVRGSGGMASKVQAAKIASWAGVDTVIASARRERVVMDAIEGRPGIGTTVPARKLRDDQAKVVRMAARKLWIAFAVRAAGRVVVDAGARRALEERGVSLLAAGILDLDGTFRAGDAVEISDEDGVVFAKGLVRAGSDEVRAAVGLTSTDLPEGIPSPIVHRDDLVVVP